jgi:hypothetical protein
MKGTGVDMQNFEGLPWYYKAEFDLGESQQYETQQSVEQWQPPLQWPLKLMRVSSVSPYFHRARLLIAADCAAFTRERFNTMTHGKILVIGCPDAYGTSFYEKLAEIVRLNEILSITLVRMDAECCGRMTDAVILAIRNSGKDITLQLTTVFTEGEIVE